MPDALTQLRYKVAGPTIQAFHDSNAFGRELEGPVGGGKSVACAVEILTRSAEQKPGPDGKRHTRWIIVRSTYGELRTATLKTWADWCPIKLGGKLTMDAPIVHHVIHGDIDMEVLFLAMDREQDADKLGSIDITGGWINEARLCPKKTLDMLVSRVGRYPPMRDGGPTWSGVMLDSNAPDTESWLYRMSRVDRPEGWAFFRQPGGLSDGAENLPNLPGGRDYYRRMLAAADPDWSRVFVHNEPGFLVIGKPVYSMFRDSVHVAPEPIPVVLGVPLLIGVDFGLTPAAIIGQRLADGRWQIIDELVAEDCGTERFAEMLSSYMLREYPRHMPEGWGDPAGLQRSQVDERSCLDVLRAHTGWRWHAAPDNSVALRLDAVKSCLNRLVDGKPGLFISPRCTVLRQGFNGAYCYKSVRTGAGEMFHDTPDKNAFSHPHDALQYLLSGGGEAAVLLRRNSFGPRAQYADGIEPSFHDYS